MDVSKYDSIFFEIEMSCLKLKTLRNVECLYLQRHSINIPEGLNRVQCKIFEPKKEEVTGGWRRLHNEELRDPCSPNIIPVIESRRMGWAGNVACTGKRRCA